MDGVQVDRFRYLLPATQETICYGGGALINLQKSRSNYLKLPLLVGAEWAAAARRVRQDVDIVSSHWILPQGLVAGFIGGGVPNVLSVHGGDVFGLQGQTLALAKRVALRRAAAVTCNSSATEQAIREIVPELKPHRIPMGIDLDVRPEPGLVSSLRSRFRRNGGPLLMFVGRVVEEKGYEDLLRALVVLVGRGSNATAVIVGEGQDRTSAERLAAELGITERVHFAGWVESASVRSYMAAADVLVAPSRRQTTGWVEAQGLSIAEGLATGVPVIATATGGIGDTVKDGHSGLLVPERDPVAIADAVERLAANDSLRRSLIVAGQQSAREHFSLDASARKFDALFREVRANRRCEHLSRDVLRGSPREQ